MKNFYIAEILLLSSGLRLSTNSTDHLETLKTTIINYLEEKKLSNKEKSNILWFNQELENFKIELARDIIREAQFANFNNNDQLRILVLLNIETALSPAQNALLKLIEEPPVNTLILLPVFNQNAILDTIRSRAQLKHLQSSNLENKQTQTNDFVWPKGLGTAIELAEKYKDRQEALIFIQSLLTNTALNTKQRNALTRAYSDLNANLNVQLCLEHCFFTTLKK